MISPPNWEIRADGALFSRDFGDVYHAAQGAWGQAQHVFLAGNELPQRWRTYTIDSHFTLLELGFGIGINFLATWHSWLNEHQRPALHYYAIENRPWRATDLHQTVHKFLPQNKSLHALAAQLSHHWPPLSAGVHVLQLDEGLTLTLLWGNAQDMLPQLVPLLQKQIDALYLDGFAPRCNPDMWNSEICAYISHLLSPDGRLSSYTVSGELRRSLADCGVVTRTIPGFAGKRAMLVRDLS